MDDVGSGQRWACPCCGGVLAELLDSEPCAGNLARFSSIEAAVESAMRNRTATVETMLRVAVKGHRCRTWRQRWKLRRLLRSLAARSLLEH